MVDANSARAWLEHTKSKGMALGLLNTQRALRELGLPPRDYETVHVAGSNGKGTVLATLSAAFSATGIAPPHVHLTASGAGGRAHSAQRISGVQSAI